MISKTSIQNEMEFIEGRLQSILDTLKDRRPGSEIIAKVQTETTLEMVREWRKEL